ncbi:hypothetical protein OJ963_13635 [Streptomyces sp. RS2]|nr:hypothetical protein [Streptomyces sp. RS2]MCW1094990.1 hypothetical protein [Streptomyces sp. RS2]
MSSRGRLPRAEDALVDVGAYETGGGAVEGEVTAVRGVVEGRLAGAAPTP